MMKYYIRLLLLSLPISILAQDVFRLAPPILKYNSIFFTNETAVELKFAQSETTVHYTLNNSEPTLQDPIYTKPILIKNNFTTVKAKAFGKQFLPSYTVTVTFIKDGFAVQSLESTLPNVKYPGNGANTLIDNNGGINQLGSDTWMGFNGDTVAIVMNLEKEQTINKVLFDFLQSESSWIFIPEKIIVRWFDSASNSFKDFGTENFIAEKETSGSLCNFKIITTTSKIKTNKISITLIPVKNMPAWHQAKGEHAWMFIDEIKLY